MHCFELLMSQFLSNASQDAGEKIRSVLFDIQFAAAFFIWRQISYYSSISTLLIVR